AVFYYDKAFQTSTNPKEKQEYKLNILQILAKQNKFAEMGRHIEEAQAITSDNLTLMFYSGRYYNQVGDYEAARNVMERATQLLKLKSNNPSEIAGYYYELGYAYYKLGLFKEAKEALKYANVGNYRALVAEMSPDYLYAVATAYYDIFDYETALVLLEEILKMDSKYAQAVELRVRIFSAQTDKASVIKEMKNATELEPLALNKVPKLIEICKLELGNKKYADAYNTADACLAIQPNNYVATFYKVVALQKMDKSLDAIKEINNILSYPGIDAETKSKCYFLMGNIYRDKGDSKSADKSYKNVTQGNYRYAAAREQKKLKEQ
ncbi:MAG: hypothetical protein RMJ89_04990, partial [Flammeovirgaceae bacterium]|nr:hypothetical protein [Flammeovirgaceae bacterium]